MKIRKPLLASLVIILASSVGCTFMSRSLVERKFTKVYQNKNKPSITVLYVRSPFRKSHTYKTESTSTGRYEYYFNYDEKFNKMRFNGHSYRYLFSVVDEMPQTCFYSELTKANYFSQVYRLVYLINAEGHYLTTNKAGDGIIPIHMRKSQYYKDPNWRIMNEDIFKKSTSDYIVLLGDVHNTYPRSHTAKYLMKNKKKGLFYASFLWSLPTLSIIPHFSGVTYFVDYAIFTKNGKFITDGVIESSGNISISLAYILAAPFKNVGWSIHTKKEAYIAFANMVSNKIISIISSREKKKN